ncbi:hypothetical protein AAFF_G00305110 [Aldrovandia affinis]|uniref:Uncharacterized protein n=1 Tax=Aldrovandia affinis TaxID=143900 RepID=A0AAD7SPC2_9TELE|nr:hypothetical protein AAFF_G00305110 [Aldrovandia affinis]
MGAQTEGYPKTARAFRDPRRGPEAHQSGVKTLGCHREDVTSERLQSGRLCYISSGHEEEGSGCQRLAALTDPQVFGGLLSAPGQEWANQTGTVSGV